MLNQRGPLFFNDPSNAFALRGTSPIERHAHTYRRLAVAVLEQAWADLQLPAIGVGAAELRERARLWFESSDADRPFAFVALCDFLGLDPGAVRAKALWGT